MQTNAFKDPAKPVMVSYDHKLAGESITMPKQRVVGLREHDMQKCIAAYMNVRGCQPDVMDDADEFVLSCGGKPGLVPTLQKPFVQLAAKEIKPVMVMYSRNDIQCRREKTPQGAVNCLETFLFITKNAPVKPVRHGPNYGCYNDGNALGTVRLPAWGAKDVLMATVLEKRAILGSGRKPVGGPGRVVDEGATPDETPAAKQARRTAPDDEVEPAFFHSADFGFYQDLVAMGNYSAVVDFTPGQGFLLYAAIVAKVPSIGFCLTAKHRDVLFTHLLSLTLQAMAKEGESSYEPRLHALLAESGDAAASQAPKRLPGPNKPKATPRRSRVKAEIKEEEAAGADEEEEEVEGDAPAVDEPADQAEAKLLATLARLNASASA